MLAGILTTLLAVFIAVALIALMVLAVCLALRHIKSSNAALKATTQLMDQRVARLKALAATCEDSELAQQIERVADDLRFSDSSVSMPIDSKIDESIGGICESLKKNGEVRAIGELDELSSLVARRRTETSCVKRGGF